MTRFPLQQIAVLIVAMVSVGDVLHLKLKRANGELFPVILIASRRPD